MVYGYCAFCEMSFYTESGLALHHFREHFDNKDQNLSYCPLCSFSGEIIYSHMKTSHPEFCSFCAKHVGPTNSPHLKCKEILEKAKLCYEFANALEKMSGVPNYSIERENHKNR